jgi:hypothetical protein
MTTPVVLLEPGNPYDITIEDLEPLKARLQECSELDVMIAYHPPRGAGITLDEVLHVWLPSAEFLRDEAYSLLLGGIIGYMRARFKNRRGEKRRKMIIIRDEHGRELKRIIIEEDQAPERTEDGSKQEKRPRPPVQD